MSPIISIENKFLPASKLIEGVITKWSLNFLKNVWNKKKYLSHYWPDNAAFMDELGYKAEFYKLKDNKPSNNVLKKFYFLSGLWNSMPKRNYENPNIEEFSNFYFDPIIISFHF